MNKPSITLKINKPLKHTTVNEIIAYCNETNCDYCNIDTSVCTTIFRVNPCDIERVLALKGKTL